MSYSDALQMLVKAIDDLEYLNSRTGKDSFKDANAYYATYRKAKATYEAALTNARRTLQ